MTLKSTVTLRAYDRQATALLLLAKLGPGYQWAPQLARWSLRDGNQNAVGLRGNPDLTLPPSFFIHSDKGHRAHPRYAPEAIAEFVDKVRRACPDLIPAKPEPSDYEIDPAAMLLPWSMRYATPAALTCAA